MVVEPTLADVWISASVVLGFQMTAFAARLAREVRMQDRGRQSWFPPAHMLNLVSMVVIVGGVFLLPGLSLPSSVEFARDGFGLGLLLFACYPFALLAHYELLSSSKTPKPGTPAGTKTILATALLAMVYVIVAAVR
jgi:hypothetical protein